MRIAEVKIKDFRVYQGNHSISFGDSSNEDANISIIAGQNGFGKTSFLTALSWVMYGRMIAEVEETYKKQIYEVGGYKEYAKALMNKYTLAEESDDKTNFFVEVNLTDIYIPSVPCSNITIRREYFVNSATEETTILIDGFVNELANQVGADIFINDFILPREIAKFFFFDAEKIVNLAEIKTLSEKKQLSIAFSDILGIKKYETLKYNLENVRSKMKRKSADIKEKEKIKELQVEIDKLENLVTYNKKEIEDLHDDLAEKRTKSDQIQEKLIREGNSITVEELKELKKDRERIQKEGQEIKAKLKDLLELAPFAIAGNKLHQTIMQLDNEISNQNKNDELISSQIKKVQDALKSRISLEIKDKGSRNDFIKILEEEFARSTKKLNESESPILLDFESQQANSFKAIYNNLKSAYKIQFENIVQEEKNNRNSFNRVLRKIQQSESKDSDLVTQKYKNERSLIIEGINNSETRILALTEENGAYKSELANKHKVLSELLKKVKLDDIDDKKDDTTQRLIKELNEFILRFKKEKIGLFEMRIRNALYKLMHKNNFVNDCEVVVNNEIIDILLINEDGKYINKESLSKGEQQLYATAVLKALVEESGIEFPVFIDSPLQKFDKNHSNNIITYFYPTVSKQVILFPLLEKELTEEEYEMLKARVDKVYRIKNQNNRSRIESVNPDELFNELKLERSNVC
ncbi:AAA family ATPase [Saccharicrinis sp. 156]|uniref:AAA family ATPase n=1 Tax=Saccharicrinis sp. 156 TaxID=3417574 RepID=UPI003D3558D8